MTSELYRLMPPRKRAGSGDLGEAPDAARVTGPEPREAPRQAERLRVLVASDPELASAAQPEAEGEGEGEQPGRRLSVIGIWESGRGDLSERHDEVIRGRLKRPA